MADNIDRLKATKQQKYLNYDIRQPFKVTGNTYADNLKMLTSQSEFYKTGFMYPSYKTFDPQNTFAKDKVHQQTQTLEFKLDLENNSVTQTLYFLTQYRNSNTNVTKNITHTSPMVNIKSIVLSIGNQSRYTIGPDEIYVFNCTRLSHGDKMFTNLIDNFGLSANYDIDPSTNSIPPSSNSKWYMFAIPLFANENIPYNLLTDNTNQCILKIELDSNKFILPSSPNTSYTDLSLNDCKLIASQLFIPSAQYDDIVKNKLIEFRINDTQKSSVVQMDTTTLLSDTVQSVKITPRQGGCSLMLIGLREKNNILTFASYIPINNISIIDKNKKVVKNQSFNTDILRNLNSIEHDTGEFFLKKDLVAYSFDTAIDRIIVTGHHGAVEVLDD